MTMDCSEVPTNVTYDCAHPWGDGCTSKKGFDFTSLWQYTLRIQGACPTDPRLFLTEGKDATASNCALTQSACAYIAREKWTEYPKVDIWTRMTTWKFPLLQLMFLFPRPPLNNWVQAFVIFHLLGDPIDTIQNLIFKLSICEGVFLYCKRKYSERHAEEELNARNAEADMNKRHAEEDMNLRDAEAVINARHAEEDMNARHDKEELNARYADKDMNARRLALVVDAYGEWGEDGVIKRILDSGALRNRANFEDVTKRTAQELAADRSTTSLNIAFAMAFFVATVGMAVGRTVSAANAHSDTVFINVEAHSIAFSAQYFWILPAVFLGSFIGVSQTEPAISHILTRFRKDLDPSSSPTELELPEISTEVEWRMYRINCGGIYSWQPSEWQWLPSSAPGAGSAVVATLHDAPLTGTDSSSNPADQSTSRQGSNTGLWRRFRNTISSYIIALSPYFIIFSSCFIVALGTVVGIIVSAFVPPDGWDCRNWAQLSIFGVWVFSASCDIGFNIYIPLSKGQPKSMEQSRNLWLWIPRFKPEGLRLERPQVKSHSLLFYLTLVKDIIATSSTMGLVIATQIGIFNRCDCQTLWGKTALKLPGTPIVNEVLRNRLNVLYPAMIFSCLAVELVIVPAIIAYRCRHALDVFLQNDDEKATVSWRVWCSLPKWSTTRFGQVKAAAARRTGWKAYAQIPENGGGEDGQGTPLMPVGP